jgi:hypothetical protein
MFICIDGSGPEDLGEYGRAFAHSFLRQAQTASTQENNRWHEGPDPSGHIRYNDLTAIAVEAIRLHREERAARSDAAQVFLGGYSRGAAGIVHVAYLLEDMHIDVDGMFLFDAVDRSVHIGDSLRAGNVDVVPANVRAVYHARRHPGGESRESFSNTATRAATSGAYREAFFLTTHGGMGGTPWGATGLLPAARRDYGSRHTAPAYRDWIRRHSHIVEPFADGSNGIDEAAAATLFGEPSDGMTELTIETEEIGSQACIDWMWAKMLLLGAVRPGTRGIVHSGLARVMASMPGRDGLSLSPGDAH